MLSAVAGIEVGHWSDRRARTGCSVVLLPEGTVASGEVRGGAPATRELELLEPSRLVEQVDAVVLSGGSAFGLAAADGVVGWLAERGRGFSTPAGPVPIVVAMSIFDLAVGEPQAWPRAADGRAAAEAAGRGEVELGLVGAGTGATSGKWRGVAGRRLGGLCGAVRHAGGLVVASLLVVNAYGDVDDGVKPGLEPADLAPLAEGERPFGHTTIGVVATNAKLSKLECHLVAQSAHDGLARSLLPVHTRFDGDAVVVAATGEVEAVLEVVRALAVTVVAEAVRSLEGR